jgi:hypothetical protein
MMGIIWSSRKGMKYTLLMVVLLHRSLPFSLRHNLRPLLERLTVPFLSAPVTTNQQWIPRKDSSTFIHANITVISGDENISKTDNEDKMDDENHYNLSTIARAFSWDDFTPSIRNATAAAVDLFTKTPNSPVCRIVTRAGGKLPTDPSILPLELCQGPHYLLDRLGLYYHAQARKVTSNATYLDAISNGQQPDEERDEMMSWQISTEKDSANRPVDDDPIQNTDDMTTVVAPVLRQSLEDAGFELLSRRDMDLCEALNAGYLLRLSILPDVSELDPSIAAEFYPEKFFDNGTKRHHSDVGEILFDGRVLVFWRGYSQEITRGRLWLPKIDYLQASLVQRSASWLKNKIDDVEVELFRRAMDECRRILKVVRRWKKLLAKRLRLREIATHIHKILSVVQANVDGVIVPVNDAYLDEDDDEEECGTNPTSSKGFTTKRSGSIRLGRYGGSKIRFVASPNPNDALEPFTICEYNYDSVTNSSSKGAWNKQPTTRSNLNATIALCEHDMYDEVNHNTFTCEYDAQIMSETERKANKLPRMQLLERVSISNLVDLFTKAGRKEVLKAIFSKSRLVEPTYEEVVVVWRPLVKQQKKKMTLPEFVSEFADMFDIEGFQQPPPEKIVVPPAKLEIRLFERVPMSNLAAVLPKTKLVFRPADAFLFDLITVVTLTLVLSSVKFESAKLDVLAVASVSVWLFRTIIRYSNKLARYDLLVKTFLTSKISQRNAGAFNYLTYEAASQRAIRSALVLLWISSKFCGAGSKEVGRDTLERECGSEVNRLLKTDKEVQLDGGRALQDLEDLQLLMFAAESGTVDMNTTCLEGSAGTVKRLWTDLMGDKCG